MVWTFFAVSYSKLALIEIMYVCKYVFMEGVDSHHLDIFRFFFSFPNCFAVITSTSESNFYRQVLNVDREVLFIEYLFAPTYHVHTYKPHYNYQNFSSFNNGVCPIAVILTYIKE